MIKITKRGVLKGLWQSVWASRPLRLGAAVVALVVIALMSTVNYVSLGYAGLAHHIVTGKVEVQSAGWHLTSPLVQVAVIDTRPQRLCIQSFAHAAVSCRLAQFDTDHVADFIAVEGWHYFWLDNRLSFNAGHNRTYRGWQDIMFGYTFSGHRYGFIKTISEE